MSSTTKVLITGGNRGLGKGFVAAYLLRPNHTVIATVRDPSNPTSKSLLSLPVGSGSSLIVVPLEGGSDTSALEAVKLLQTKHNITSLDLVIANAGIAEFYGTAVNTPLAGTREHFNINAVGTLGVFQAVFPLLSATIDKGGPAPKFVAITSTAGSIGEMEKLPMISTAYGASKAALNYIVKKIHMENPGLIAFPLNPGWVKTDMGNAGALAHGMAEAPLTLEESLTGMLSKIDGATRENASGKLVTFNGEEPSW